MGVNSHAAFIMSALVTSTAAGTGGVSFPQSLPRDGACAMQASSGRCCAIGRHAASSKVPWVGERGPWPPRRPFQAGPGPTELSAGDGEYAAPAAADGDEFLAAV